MNVNLQRGGKAWGTCSAVSHNHLTWFSCRLCDLILNVLWMFSNTQGLVRILTLMWLGNKLFWNISCIWSDLHITICCFALCLFLNFGRRSMKMIQDSSRKTYNPERKILLTSFHFTVSVFEGCFWEMERNLFIKSETWEVWNWKKMHQNIYLQVNAFLISVYVVQ